MSKNIAATTYVTSTGNKYHEENCKCVKNKTDASRMIKEGFESGKYDPCKSCLPEKNTE